LLLATYHYCGNVKIRPDKIETADLIEIKFGTFDYVGETTPCAKFYANQVTPKGQGRDPKSLRPHISVTVPDRCMVVIGHLQEMLQGDNLVK